jgi:VanZ family protein
MSMRHAGRAIFWLVTLAWAAQIYNFSTATYGGVFTTWLLSQVLRLLHVTVSSPTFNLLHELMRKSAHVTVYGIFAMLLYYSLGGSRSREWRWLTALGALLIAGGYALTDEYHQLFVPGRGPSLVDSGIDTMGALVGLTIIYIACRLGNRRQAASEAKVEAAV